MESLPLLTVSSQQVRAIIASRAERLLTVSTSRRGGGDEISCTPAFGSSSLAKEVWSGGVAKRGKAKEPDKDELLLAVSDDEKLDSEGDEECDAGKDARLEVELCCTSRKKTEEDAIETKGLNTEGGEERGGDWDGDAMSCSVKDDASGSEREEEGGAGSSQREGDTLLGDSEQEILSPSAVGGALQEGEGTLPRISFVEDMKSVSYPTLWELGACELTNETVADFYVPALSSVVRPSKVCVCVCVSS